MIALSPVEAISYTWEGQKASPDHYILCQSENRKESKLLITKNADAALRGLRLNDKVRFLWIDSVCINQDSEIERNSQVENMGYIYKYARRVVVWLGEALNEGSSLTLKDMRMIATLDPDDASSREKLDDLFKQLLQGEKKGVWL